MKQKPKISTATNPAREKFSYQSPVLFSIPANYEDALVVRNKSYYLRMQRIERKYEKIRLEMVSYTMRHDLKSKQTREMIEITLYMLNKFKHQKQVQFSSRRLR